MCVPPAWAGKFIGFSRYIIIVCGYIFLPRQWESLCGDVLWQFRDPAHVRWEALIMNNVLRFKLLRGAIIWEMIIRMSYASVCNYEYGLRFVPSPLVGRDIYIGPLGLGFGLPQIMEIAPPNQEKLLTIYLSGIVEDSLSFGWHPYMSSVPLGDFLRHHLIDITVGRGLPSLRPSQL